MTLRTALWGGMMVLAGSTMGCIATPNWIQYTLVNQPPRPLLRRTPESVDVFLDHAPARPHLDVGLFEVRRGLGGDGYYRPVGDAVASLRLHGALRGCDAVAVLDLDQGHRYDGAVVRAVCAMYTDAQATQTKLAPPPPLPDEGKVCSIEPIPYGETSLAAQTGQNGCTDPLTCVNRHCISPYH
jgi:hypothetical protein